MNRPYVGFGIEQRSDLSSERRRCEQSFLAVRQRNARPVLADAVSVFSQVGGRVANRQRMRPDQARSLCVRVGIFDAELFEVGASQFAQVCSGWRLLREKCPLRPALFLSCANTKADWNVISIGVKTMLRANSGSETEGDAFGTGYSFSTCDKCGILWPTLLNIRWARLIPYWSYCGVVAPASIHRARH